MYVILDRALPHVADGLKPGATADRLRDVRARSAGRVEPRRGHLRPEGAPRGEPDPIQEVGAHRGRRPRQVPSPRRHRLLRGDGADGAAVRDPLPPRRRAGELGFDRRSPLVRRDALYRGAADPVRGPVPGRAGAGDGSLQAQLRRHHRGAGAASRPPAGGAAERNFGHRGGNGHRHSAPQPPRGRRRVRASPCRARRDDRHAVRARARAGLSHRRRNRHLRGGPARDLPQRQRQRPGPRRVRTRARAHPVRGGDGAPVPGLGGPGDGADRRSDGGTQAAHGGGPPGRVGRSQPGPARAAPALESRRRAPG